MLIEKKEVSQLIQIFQKPQIQNDSKINFFLLERPRQALAETSEKKKLRPWDFNPAHLCSRTQICFFKSLPQNYRM